MKSARPAHTASKRGFSPKDRKLALLLARGSTRAEAAEVCGLSERSIYLKLANAAFAELVAELQDRIVGQVVAKLVGASVKAVDTLVDLADNSNAATRLGAAKALLAEMVNIRTHADLAADVAEIKKRLADNGYPRRD